MNKTKLIFFGTSDFVVTPLERLIESGYDVVAVIVSGNHSGVGKYAEEHNLQVISPQSLKGDDFFEEFKKLKPELCVVASYGKIIPKRYLEIPKFGFLNIHPSLLPRYRGPSPVPAALLAGDNITGVTIIKMDAEVDHGPILTQTELDIQPEDTTISLLGKLFSLGTDLLIKILPRYISGELKPREQDHLQASFTQMIKTEDGEITPVDTIEQALNKIRALNPEPGTYMKVKSKNEKVKNEEIRLKVLMAEKSQKEDLKWPSIKLRDGYLILKTVQPAGKKPMSSADWLRGRPEVTKKRSSR